MPAGRSAVRRFIATVVLLVVVGLGVTLAASSAEPSLIGQGEPDPVVVGQSNIVESQAAADYVRDTQATGEPVVTPQKQDPATGPAERPSGQLVERLTTRFASTYAQPDGTVVSHVSAIPVNYRDAQGDWQAIDDTLVADGDGVSIASDRYALHVPRSLASGPVQIGLGGNGASFQLDGAADVAGATAGSTSTFADALPGTTVAERATPRGLSETLTIADASAPQTFSYAVAPTQGLTPAQQQDGSIAFLDADGTAQLRIAAPFMFAGAAEAAVPMQIAREGAGWRLTLSPDRDWVLAHLADGPVTIDPEWEFDDDGDDCRMDQNSPTTSFCGSTNLEVGWNGTKDHTSVLRFDLGSVLPKDAIVSYAEFGMYQYSHSTSTAKQVGVYRATQPWTSAATWNKYDATHSWTSAGGDSVSTNAAVTSGLGTANGWVAWYPTQIVQQWADGTQPNDGFLVKDAASSVNNDLNFRSGSYSDSDYWPYLDVQWRLRVGDRPSYTFVRQQLDDRADLAVNVANGNLLLHSSDLHVSGTAGHDLSVDRYYNSLLQNIGFVGSQGAGATVAPGLDRWIRGLDDGSIELFMGDGSVFPFHWNGSTYETPPGLNAQLVAIGGGAYKVTFNSSGEQWLFNDGIDTEVNEIKDRYGNTIVNDHRSGGSVSGWTDTQGRVTDVDTDGSGHRYITHFEDSSGRDYTYAFDGGYTHLTTYTDPNSKTTGYGYDGSGRLTSITLPSGNVTKITYDSTSGRVATIMRTTNVGHTTGPTTSFSYSTGSPCATGESKTVVSDPVANGSNGHTVTYCADTRDRVTKTVDSSGNAHSATFTANDDVATGTPASGGADSYGYDAASNLISLQQGGSGGPTTTWAYADTNAPFDPSKQTDPQGNYQHGTYAGASNPSGPQGSLLQVDTTAQTGESSQTPNVQSTFTHNSDGTVATSTDANGNVTTYGYDADGNLTTITPPSGSGLGVETVTPDSLSRPHVITAHVSSTLTRSATITYDLFDRITQVDYANSSATGAFSVSYVYDDDGNRTSRVDPQGTTSYTFDKLNRLTEDNPPGTVDNTYAYDDAGNMTSFVDGSGTTTYGYNGLNELTSMLEPSDATATAFAYDTNHRLTRTTYPGGVTLSRAYDSNTGQLTSITNRQPPAGTGTILSQYTFSYTLGAGKAALVQSTAASDGTNTNTTAYTYDALDRLTGAVTTGPTLNQYFAYTMDANGNRTRQVVNLSGSTSTGATTTSYGYNSGNQLCWKYTGTSSNACGSVPTGATTYTFNQAGDETAGSTGGLSFSYNNAGQTTSLTPSGGSATGLAYLDGGQQQLITNGSTSVANSQLGVSSTTTSGATTYYGRTPDGTLVDERNSSGRYWYVFGNDVVGSVSGVVSSTGTSHGTWGYTPYGEANGGSGSDPNPFKFAGGYTLPGGFTHFGARYLDPSLGRWTQQDPLRQIADLGQADRYVYAGATPLSAADPNGANIIGDATSFVKRNAGKVASIISDQGSAAAASLGLGYAAGPCFAGAAAAGPAAPLALAGCATFVAGSAGIIGYSEYSSVKTASTIK